MIPVRVAQLSVAQISPSDVSFVLLLRGVSDPRSLPIFIAATEAQSIAIKLNGKEFPRPLTHDLLKSVLESGGGRLVRVDVCDLVDNTFFAQLFIEGAAGPRTVDSRPSDAVALALRCAAPIYVAESVMDKAGVLLEETPEGHTAIAGEQAPPSELDRLKQQLDESVRAERFEEAARLRDAIKELEDKSHPN